MTEDEAETVAALAAQCARGARSSWDLIMRYGRLSTSAWRGLAGPDDAPPDGTPGTENLSATRPAAAGRAPR